MEQLTGSRHGSLPIAAPGERIEEPVQVLYIAGIGRSGSTLLCRTLGSVDGFFASGELMRILGRGLLTGDLCSCGAPVIDCELWRRVHEDVQRRSPGLDFEALERTRKRITEGWEFLRYLFLPNGRTDLGRDLRAYREFLTALYQSVRAVTGARVIVDASKNLLFGKLLTETPGLRVTFLHLIRDSRGVAYSLMRRQQRPGTPGREEHFRQIGPTLGSILWSSAQLMTEVTGRRTEGRYLVRYEDFVSDPAAVVRGIVEEVDGGADRPALPHIHGRTVSLGTDHLIASNPNRERRGDIELREDRQWREGMSRGRRYLITGMTFPLLYRYGYSPLPLQAPRREARGNEAADL